MAKNYLSDEELSALQSSLVEAEQSGPTAKMIITLVDESSEPEEVLISNLNELTISGVTYNNSGVEGAEVTRTWNLISSLKIVSEVNTEEVDV